jgi:hypothetical protein
VRFQELFRSYTRSHGRYVMGAKNAATGKVEKKMAWTEQGAPSERDWEEHLAGTGVGLGMLPLLDDNVSVCWGAIDIDRYPVNHTALEVDAQNLPLTMTKSKSDGAHLWCFTVDPVPAKLMVARLTEWAAALGYGGVEIFPKQTSRQITEAKADVGNWINLPYFGNTRQCVYHGQDVGLETFLELAESRMITKEILEKIKIVSDDEGSEFVDGPPCLQMMSAMGGAPTGFRNNYLFAVGIYLQAKYPNSWGGELRHFNETHCKPPIDATELSATIDSLSKKQYNYTCTKPPLSQHCNRPECIKRDYGVARQGSGELNIVLSGLTQITTKPPRWLLNIDGARVELESTLDLDQARFRKFAIESVHKIPSKVSAIKWDAVIQGLLDQVEVVQAPPEASPQGQFLEHVLRFIETHGQSESRDQLLNGRVFLENGHAYFRASDLFSYLKRERFVELKTAAMYSILHDVGVARDRFNCKGATVAMWRVEMSRFNLSMQNQDSDAPTFKDPFGDTKNGHN